MLELYVEISSGSWVGRRVGSTKFKDGDQEPWKRVGCD